MDHPLTQAAYTAFHHTSALLQHPGLHNTWITSVWYKIMMHTH